MAGFYTSQIGTVARISPTGSLLATLHLVSGGSGTDGVSVGAHVYVFGETLTVDGLYAAAYKLRASDLAIVDDRWGPETSLPTRSAVYGGGHLWIATPSDLWKVNPDGAKVQEWVGAFSTTPFRIARSPDGDIFYWVAGTSNKGDFGDRAIRRYSITSGALADLASVDEEIEDLCTRPNGEVIGLTVSHVYRWSAAGVRLTKIEVLGVTDCESAALDADGVSLWIHAGRPEGPGIYRVNVETGAGASAAAFEYPPAVDFGDTDALWLAAETTPPLRLFPRDDQATNGGTARLYPPPSSRQEGGARLYPSYW